MKAVRLTPAGTPETVRRACDAEGLFCSQAFGELWHCVKGRLVYWCVRHSDQVCAAMPGVEFGVGPMRRFQAMPDGCYAAVTLFDDTLERQVAARQLLDGIIGFGYARSAVADYDNVFAVAGHLEAVEHETTLVDISLPDWQPPDAGLRTEIRKAQREGVTAVTFDIERHLDSFLTLVTETERRHGREPKYPPEFYRGLAELAAADDRLQWLVVEHDGTVAASHINILHRNALLNWQIYFDKRRSALKPNQLMLYTAATLARERGIQFVNLGATPEQAKGVAAFKRKWGGEAYRYQTLMARSMLGKLA